VNVGKACVVKNLDTEAVLGRFEGKCSTWTVSVNPKDDTDVILTMGRGASTSVLRKGKPLPALDEGSVDAVGFDSKGSVVMYVDQSIDERLKHDRTKKVSYVMAEGERLEVPYEEDRMFGVSLCRYLTWDKDAWKPLAKPAIVELHEGMSSPMCGAVDSSPQLTGLQQPGLDEAMPAKTRGLSDVPPALAAIPHDENNGWVAVDALDLAVGMMWFEGERYQEPVVRRDGEAFVVLEGFGTPRDYSRSVQLFLRNDHLLVCTNNEAHLYDRNRDYERVWHGAGGCPVFWPPDA
jgi:hypothetical protein